VLGGGGDGAFGSSMVGILEMLMEGLHSWTHMHQPAGSGSLSSSKGFVDNDDCMLDKAEMFSFLLVG
jgi:hypothetical protein